MVAFELLCKCDSAFLGIKLIWLADFLWRKLVLATFEEVIGGFIPANIFLHFLAFDEIL